MCDICFNNDINYSRIWRYNLLFFKRKNISSSFIDYRYYGLFLVNFIFGFKSLNSGLYFNISG